MSRFPRTRLGDADPQDEQDESESAPLTGNPTSSPPPADSHRARIARNPPVFSNFSLPHRPLKGQRVKISADEEDDEVHDTFIEDPQLALEQSIPMRKIMHSHSRQASRSSIKSPRTGRRPGHSRNNSRGSVRSVLSNDGDESVLFGKDDDDDSSIGTPGGRRIRRVRWHHGETPLEGRSRMNSFEIGQGLDGGGGEFMWSKEAENRVVRKFDIYLVGFMAGLYTLSFLDRSSEFLNHHTTPHVYFHTRL
jgi:hypothetical protein